MKACGLIVEYNPFHNGHLYHVERAKESSNADCMIAVMSGSFLQRGEPAIIDKFHRTHAALSSGIDIVVELPYPFAVQSSELFAKGAVSILNTLGSTFICFGSESGEINHFLNSITHLHNNKSLYDETIRSYLKSGLSFPDASSKAYEAIGLEKIDLVQPNNILGFSYVKTIKELGLSITPLTIKRTNSNYHEVEISGQIASATSIRKELLENGFTQKVTDALPLSSLTQIKEYKKETTFLHTWDDYFPYLQYRIMSMSLKELRNIHGVEEGLEYRIKKTLENTTSFSDWMEKIKTKRYTQVRLQRIFVHILTNTTKQCISGFIQKVEPPYIRLLGMSATGQAYLNKIKQEITVPIVSNLNRKTRSLLAIDEKVTNVYYSVLPASKRNKMRSQEFSLPIRKK